MHKFTRSTETKVWSAHGYLVRTGSEEVYIYLKVPSFRKKGRTLPPFILNLFLHKCKIIWLRERRENNSRLTELRASKEQEELSSFSIYEDEREHPFSLSFSPAGLSIGKYVTIGKSKNTSENPFLQVWKRK